MRKIFGIFYFVILFLLNTGIAFSQDVILPEPGEKLKVWITRDYSPDFTFGIKPNMANLVRISHNSLTLESVERKTFRVIPLEYISKIQRCNGIRDLKKEGRIAGFLAGMGLALILTISAGEDDHQEFSSDNAFLINTTIFGVAGVLAGHVIGSTLYTDNWVDIPPESLRSIGLPQRSLGVEFRFPLRFGNKKR